MTWIKKNNYFYFLFNKVVTRTVHSKVERMGLFCLLLARILLFCPTYIDLIFCSVLLVLIMIKESFFQLTHVGLSVTHDVFHTFFVKLFYKKSVRLSVCLTFLVINLVLLDLFY